MGDHISTCLLAATAARWQVTRVPPDLVGASFFFFFGCSYSLPWSGKSPMSESRRNCGESTFFFFFKFLLPLPPLVWEKSDV